MTPITSQRRSLNVRILPELYDALAAVAHAEDNTVSSVARRALALGVTALTDVRIRPDGDPSRFEAR